MADTKITALAAIGANPINVATFPIPMVDLLDNSMAASGTTKKVTVNQILGAGGTATLASATITGAANFNGGATAGYLNGGLLFGSSGNYVNLYGQSNGLLIKDNTGVYTMFSVANSGVFTFGDGAGGTRMTLNSTGLGVGGSPSARIHAIDSSGVCGLFTRAAAPAAALSAVYIQAPVASGFSSTPVLGFWYQNTGISNPASETLSIRTSSAERVRYGSDGNAYHSLQGAVPTIPNNGEMVFNFTSNTNLRISARGSDGVTRFADITLA